MTFRVGTKKHTHLNPVSVPLPPQILYWESLRLDVPFDAVEVDAQRHRHAALRHRMMEVVRKYNQASSEFGVEGSGLASGYGLGSGSRFVTSCSRTASGSLAPPRGAAPPHDGGRAQVSTNRCEPSSAGAPSAWQKISVS